MTVLSKRRRKRRKKNSKGLSIIAFVVVVFCLCAGIYTMNLKHQKAELEEKHAAIEKQMKEEKQRKKELEELEKYMQTKKNKKDVAKEKMGLIYSDEILMETR